LFCVIGGYKQKKYKSFCFILLKLKLNCQLSLFYSSVSYRPLDVIRFYSILPLSRVLLINFSVLKTFNKYEQILALDRSFLLQIAHQGFQISYARDRS